VRLALTLASPAFALALLLLPPLAAQESAWSALSPALRAVGREQADLRRELAALGTPLVGQTVAEFGYLHPRLPAPPPASPWVQIDLQSPQPIDWIALIPAQVDWQPAGGPAYGFPPRFRVDLSDVPDFSSSVPIAVFTESDFPEPGIAPVPLRAGGRVARYVRVTVTKLAVENSQHFFALAELMIVSGGRNLAVGRPVQANAAGTHPPRWSRDNLVDGRTPLGPPVTRELLPYDGLYTGPDGGRPLFMQLDLGRPLPLQEVRLHPVHARLGADIPGFLFPSRFRLEASDAHDFSSAVAIFTTGETDFPNPGNNPVTLRAEGITARYLRFTMLAPSRSFTRDRFGLSEIEVYSGNHNVARTATVTGTPDPAPMSRDWPKSQLVDGFTSYGRLVELPAWLAGWQRRAEIRARLDALDGASSPLAAAARHRAAWLAGGLALALLGVATGFIVRQRRRRAAELEELRTRLARDLHDEIGSNLAGLAVLSESLAQQPAATPAARDDWLEVNRIAHESTDAMREVLWVVGAREEAGFELPEQFRRAAARALTGRTVNWTDCTAPLAADWPADCRRQAFLFFKEALANVARHSAANVVDISATLRDGFFELTVYDHGRGFDPATAARGIGLTSLRDRARNLGGTCTITTHPGNGTRVTLRVPVTPAAPSPRSP